MVPLSPSPFRTVEDAEQRAFLFGFLLAFVASMTTSSGADPRKDAAAVTRNSPVCRMHVFCSISCATVLRVAVCQAACVKRARCLEDSAAEADDFKALLEDRTFDVTLADGESPMWSPWLPIASPPTPPVRPKAKAFVKEQLSSEAVPEVKRRRRWSRSLHFPEEFRCREDSAGEAAVAVVACPDAHDTEWRSGFCSFVLCI